MSILTIILVIVIVGVLLWLINVVFHILPLLNSIKV